MEVERFSLLGAAASKVQFDVAVICKSYQVYVYNEYLSLLASEI
jgi:hypothetical protein